MNTCQKLKSNPARRVAMRCKRDVLVLVTASLLCLASGASARVLAVFQGGRITVAARQAAFSCSDPATPNLVAVFEEDVDATAPPATLTLEEKAGGSGQVDLGVRIVDACSEGSITFQYRHESAAASGDLDINPRQFSITLPLTDGAGNHQIVNYAVIDDNEAEDQESVSLVGYNIVFFTGNASGQTSGHRVMARVIIPANNEQVVDEDDIPDDMPDDQLEVLDTLDAACTKAEDGSDFGEACDDLDLALDGDDDDERRRRARRIADELEPEVAAVAPASMLAVGRSQYNNVQSRLHVLRERTGSSGNSNVNLRLAMNGKVFDSRWIQDYIHAASGQDGGSGSRLLSDKWGFFLNGSINLGDRERELDTPAHDFNFSAITGGVDYRFDHGIILGAAIGYTRFDTDMDEADASAESDAWTVTGFGTFDVAKNLYIDATVAWGVTDFQQMRVVDLSAISGVARQTLRGSTDVTQLSGSLALNYRAYLGNGWTLTPYGSVYFARTEADPFSESGGAFALGYQGYSFDSMLSSLGARASTAINLDTGVLAPFVDLAFQHEGGMDPFQIDTSYLAVASAGPTISIGQGDQSFGNLAAGVVWVFASGNQLVMRASSRFGNSQQTLYAFYIGGRFEF